MDIIVLDPNLLEAIQQRTSMIQYRVYNNTCAEGKGQKIRHRVSCREIEWRIFIVRRLVKGIVWAKNAGDVILLAKAIIGLVCRDWEVS
jgi:hypothetical protein